MALRALPAFRCCWLALQSVSAPRWPAVTICVPAGPAASLCCWLALQLGGSFALARCDHLRHFGPCLPSSVAGLLALQLVGVGLCAPAACIRRPSASAFAPLTTLVNKGLLVSPSRYLAEGLGLRLVVICGSSLEVYGWLSPQDHVVSRAF